jgi:hypothetical protein
MLIQPPLPFPGNFSIEKMMLFLLSFPHKFVTIIHLQMCDAKIYVMMMMMMMTMFHFIALCFLLLCPNSQNCVEKWFGRKMLFN